MFFPASDRRLLVRESRTSSANGAFGLHERQASAGMRLAYCRGGIGVREDGGTGAGLRAGAAGGCGGGGAGVIFSRISTSAASSLL
jgi:hypothetical protein